MSSYGPKVLSYGDNLIRQSEVDILNTSEWLNDTIIAFYFDFLSDQFNKEGNPCVRLYHPGLSQFLKMKATEPGEILGEPQPDEIQYAFWAVNDSSECVKGASGSHWSLLVFSRPDNRFFHYDSAFSGEQDAVAIVQNIGSTFSRNSTLVNFSCHKQANGYDCGLHVLRNAEFILTFIKAKQTSKIRTPKLFDGEQCPSTATPSDATRMRMKLLRLINTLKNENALNVA